MKETIDPLKQALIEILNTTNAGVKKASAFLMSELPDVIQQLLLWKMWESIIINLTPLILGVIFPVILLLKIGVKGFKNFGEDTTNHYGVGFIIGIFWCGLGAIIFFSSDEYHMASNYDSSENISYRIRDAIIEIKEK